MKIIIFVSSLVFCLAFSGTLAQQASYFVQGMSNTGRIDESAALYGAFAGSAVYVALLSSMYFLYKLLWPKESNIANSQDTTTTDQFDIPVKPSDIEDIKEDRQSNMHCDAETLEAAFKVKDEAATDLSNAEIRPARLSDGPKVKEMNITQKANINDFSKAQTAIEYMPEVAAGWNEIQNLPERFKLAFLQSIEVDTKQPIDELVSKIREEHYQASNPYKNPELNSAFKEIKTFGGDAVSEFHRVIDVLGEDVDVQHTINTLREKYFHPEKQMLQHAIQNYSEAGIIEALRSMGFLVEVITDAYSSKSSYRITSENNSVQVHHGIDALYDFARSQL